MPNRKNDELELAPLVNDEGKGMSVRHREDDGDDDLDALLEYEGEREGRSRDERLRGTFGWKRVFVVVFSVLGVIFLFLMVFLGILVIAGSFSRFLLWGEDDTPSTWTGWQDVRYLFILYESPSTIPPSLL